MKRRITDKQIRKSVSAWLTEHRKVMGMTQTRLSRATGVPQSTISKLENRGLTPGVRQAFALAQYLKIPTEQLCGLY